MRNADWNTVYGIVPLAEIERTEIEYALDACPDRKTAAQCLGIGITTLYRKLREYREADAAEASEPAELVKS